MKILQFTDLHFVPPGVRLLDLDPRAQLEACIADINAQHGDAVCCLITGDLADRGHPDAYAALRDCLSALQVPYHLLIGNHDSRENFRSAFPETPCDAKGFVQSVVRSDAGDLFLLDTHEPGSGAGSYCAQRCAWLREKLAAAGGRPVYLFMHHPPFDIGIPSLDAIRLIDAEGLEAVLAEATDLRHLFFGHVHRPVSGSWCGIPFSALRSTAHQVPLDFNTARPVPYSHEPPAYAVIHLMENQTTVHLHDFLDHSTLPADKERYS